MHGHLRKESKQFRENILFRIVLRIFNPYLCCFRCLADFYVIFWARLINVLHPKVFCPDPKVWLRSDPQNCRKTRTSKSILF